MSSVFPAPVVTVALRAYAVSLVVALAYIALYTFGAINREMATVVVVDVVTNTAIFVVAVPVLVAALAGFFTLGVLFVAASDERKRE